MRGEWWKKVHSAEPKGWSTCKVPHTAHGSRQVLQSPEPCKCQRKGGTPQLLGAALIFTVAASPKLHLPYTCCFQMWPAVTVQPKKEKVGISSAGHSYVNVLLRNIWSTKYTTNSRGKDCWDFSVIKFVSLKTKFTSLFLDKYIMSASCLICLWNHCLVY